MLYRTYVLIFFVHWTYYVYYDSNVFPTRFTYLPFSLCLVFISDVFDEIKWS